MPTVPPKLPHHPDDPAAQDVTPPESVLFSVIAQLGQRLVEDPRA